MSTITIFSSETCPECGAKRTHISVSGYSGESVEYQCGARTNVYQKGDKVVFINPCPNSSSGKIELDKKFIAMIQRDLDNLAYSYSKYETFVKVKKVLDDALIKHQKKQ